MAKKYDPNRKAKTVKGYYIRRDTTWNNKSYKLGVDCMWYDVPNADIKIFNTRAEAEFVASDLRESMTDTSIISIHYINEVVW